MSVVVPKKTKTVVIKAGDTGTIPFGVNIISVGILGNVDAESDCANVNTAIGKAETYACYEFVWEADVTGGGNAGSWEVDGVVVEAIELGNTRYEIETSINEINETTPGLAGKIKQVVPNSIMNIGDNTTDKAWHERIDAGRATHAICFNTLPSIAAQLRMKFRNDLLDSEFTESESPIYYIYPRLLSKTSSWCQCPTTTTTSAP